MRNLIKDISFKTDDGKLKGMFSTIAEEVAEKLQEKTLKKGKEKDISITQYRKFYDKIVELNDKAQGLEKEEFENQILPFVKMLVSKVEYSRNREKSGENFSILMKESIKKVNSQEELQNFKYFLEAIIGYMPK